MEHVPDINSKFLIFQMALFVSPSFSLRVSPGKSFTPAKAICSLYPIWEAQALPPAQLLPTGTSGLSLPLFSALPWLLEFLSHFSSCSCNKCITSLSFAYRFFPCLINNVFLKTYIRFRGRKVLQLVSKDSLRRTLIFITEQTIWIIVCF